MADNPSVVNDSSGNNYTLGAGIGGDAQMQYLENLSQLAQKMPPKPLNTEQYFPGSREGIQVGASSSKTLGSQPIFASGGGLIPFAMLDEIDRAKAEAEANYYKNLKLELDKPLFDLKAKLSDPFKQPAFANKIQQTADTVLEKYAARFGGDYAKAYIATQHDKNFQRTMQGYQQYADMFNLVGAKLTDVLAAEEKGDYVSPAVKQAIKEFSNSVDAIEDLPPSKLLEDSQKFKSVMGVASLADSITKGIKDTIVDKYSNAPSANMSTDQKNVWIKTSTSNEGLADKLYVDAIKTHPEYDENAKVLLKSEIQARIDHSVKQATDIIEKSDADRNMALNKSGIRTDKDGNIQLTTKPAALVEATGENAVSYPVETKPIPSIVGMVAFVRKDGKLRRVKFPESYNMKLQSEYDITEQSSGVARGRYVEANVDFQSTAPYNSTIYRNVKGVPVDVGETKGVTQILPVTLEDLDTHETIEMIGSTTILTPYENLKTTVEANVPYMGFVHDQLDKQTYPNGSRRTYGLSNETSSAPTPLTDAMTINDVKPDVMYVRNGKTISGADLWKKHNESLNKK
jgi:hypothetical protein